MIDSFRAVRPNEVTDRGYTWTPGYPFPTLDSNEVRGRVDFIYHGGFGVTSISASTIGPLDGDSSTDISVPGFNSDHRAVMVTFQLPVCSIFADLNGDCTLDAADWMILRGLSTLTYFR